MRLACLPLIFLIFLCGSALAAGAPATVGQTDLQDDALLKSLSLKKKIGQMLMIGFQGTSTEEGLSQLIQEVSPGGIIVFGRNITSARQISDLLLNAQKLSLSSSSVPLLTATDQEGGDVIRIKTAAPLPSALALGKTGRADVALSAGFATGKLLKTLGFNMNLAPVLDVSDEKQEMFIGTRAYGNDPSVVGKIGTGFSEGLYRAGVLPTGKHFPGHGGVVEDSHLKVPVKLSSLESLRNIDLAPFKEMQRRFPNRWAAMLAHVAFPNVDTSGAPATQSKKIVNDLLRGELGFRGLVITDDINMGGRAQQKTVSERAIRSIEAGSDMIVVAWNKNIQRELISSIEKAVQTGRISISQIDEHLRRIFYVKRTFARVSVLTTPPSNAQIEAAIKNSAFLSVGDAVVDARMSQIFSEGNNPPSLLAELESEHPIFVFSANDRFSSQFRLRLKSLNVQAFKIDPLRPVNIDKIMAENPNAFGVFYVSGYQAGKIASKIGPSAAKRMMVVNVESSSILKNAANFRSLSDVYYRHPNLGRIIAERYFLAE